MILYGKNGNRLKESKPQKKISPAALSKDTDAFLRGFRGGTALGGLRPPRAAKNSFVVGSGRQFRLGRHPTANGRYPSSFSIKQI